MKYRILVTAPPILPKIEKYKSIFEKKSIEVVIPPYNVVESLNEAQLIELLVNIDGILCGDDELNSKVLQKSKSLKVISKWGTGIDSINSKVAKKLNIKVLRVQNVFSEPVSDTVMAYILAFSRKIFEKDQLVRTMEWRKEESYTLSEKSIGIIGLGHIGRLVAKKASIFGMEINGYDIKYLDEKNKNILDNINICNLNELLKNSDFITLHCDLNKESHHLISTQQFNIMKPNAIIINTSRGAVIDQAALEVALFERKIFGAALDVFETEPLPKNNILRKLKNVFLSPHNSNASPKVFNNVDNQSINNLINGLYN